MTAPLLVMVLAGTTPQLPLSLAGTDDALAVFANPAGLGVGRRFDGYCFYDFRQSGFLTNATFAANVGPLAGFWEPRPSRWGLALGGGGKGVYGGARFVRDSLGHWDIGALWRPLDQLSIGALWQDISREGGRVFAGVAVRPLGDRLTVFGDLLVGHRVVPYAGIRAEPVPGLVVDARVRLGDGIDVSAGLMLQFGRAGLGFVASPVSSEYAGIVRLGAERRRTLLPSSKRYLDVKLAGAVADQKPGFSLTGSGRVRTAWTLLSLLDRAGRDRSVRGLLLRLDSPRMSVAQAQELRDALLDFRARGKRVVVHGHQFGMLDYYLASAADRIITHPLSDITIPGIAATTTFLKGTLEKLDIKPQPTRHGRYKSAIETFTEDSLTAANREQYEALVDGVYRAWVAGVAQGRNMSAARVESLVNRAFFIASDARAAGLVDTCCYDDELDSLLCGEFGRLRRVPEARYARDDSFAYRWHSPPRVAVIYAGGSIGGGESGTDFLTGERNMGARTMTRAIREVRNDRAVRAVVLRIDSPGGDGFASDLIWRELELTRKKKPVIVSMAGVAASGGYYIACNADRIYALPSTITGSIGVFSIGFVTEGLYNKLGARRQAVKRGEHADMGDLRTWTPEEDSMVQAIVDRFYEQFIAKVATGRHLTTEQVDAVGQGRVWVGSDAVEVGLVDSLGGLHQAIDCARNRARLREYELSFYPRVGTGLGAMLRERFSEWVLGMRPW